MKLHLPLSLFKSLMSLMLVAASTVGQSASAAVLHQDVSFITYADFGQNAGRYSVGVTNELLQYVNRNGVVLTYTGGQADYVLPNGMIDFGSGYYRSTAAAISPSAVATVKHNGAISSDFTSQYAGIGSSNAIRYKAIEYKGSDTFSHITDPANPVVASSYNTDHKVTRLSKIITDAPYVEVYDAAKGISGKLFYHAGSGRYVESSYSGAGALHASAYQFVMGGIMGLTTYQGRPGDAFSAYQNMNYGAAGVNSNSPMPWISQDGDSGSPVYVWDETSKSYQYFGGTYGGDAGNRMTVISSNTNFDKETVESFHEYVDMSGLGKVYLNGVTHQGETITGNIYDKRNNKIVLVGSKMTTPVFGQVSTDAAGQNVLKNAAGNSVEYVGVASGLNTWGNLSAVKDSANWYNYGQDYVLPTVEDLYFTENLLFVSSDARNEVVLNATVDLGVGYAQFCRGEGAAADEWVRYDISAAGDGSYQFNHAGYVIDAGVEVHTTLTGSSSYMYEWRKIGAGNLHIEGSGNNNILLNIGGSGKTYLNRQNGYAAYNVLVNNGATIIISDVNQIKRDLTFGNRGGTLNMNGQSMDWYQTAEAAGTTRNGFSINALSEAALIANDKGSSTLTYRETKDSTYVGSFADTATASLKIVHDSDATWTLNSIRTNLQHENSGLQVNRGKVVLSGTNTVHAYGSDLTVESKRYSNEDDWHYADARMNVAVNSGTFELGSHARLTGDVTVAENGTFVMREGVRHQMEYVEGGARLEDTDQYSAYFGHKGTVQLNGGTFAVQFNEGADSTLEYAGNVTGQGFMTVDTGVAGGTLSFSGTVDAGVSKTLERGQLVLTGAAAADTSNKWLVKTGGVMAQLDNVSDTLAVIDGASSGIIGLKGGVCTEQVDFSATHSQLGIGALAGETVQYGAEGTTETYKDIKLGGSGKMEVNYVLSGSTAVNVDGVDMGGGVVVFHNIADDYAGVVNVASRGGDMTLSVADLESLSRAEVNVNAGGVLHVSGEQTSSVFDGLHVNQGGIIRASELSLSGKSWALSGRIESGMFSVADAATLTVNPGASWQSLQASGQDTKIELSGSASYESLLVRDGATLNLRANGRLDADNAATIAQGGIMRLNLQTLQDKVELTDGGIMYGNGGTIGAEATVLAAEGTGKLNAGGGKFTVNADIGASKDATLRLENGAFDIYTGSINSAGGTLELACSTVNLGHKQNEATLMVGGTLKVANDLTIYSKQGNASKYQGMTVNINHLQIDNCTLTLETSRGEFRHIYNIDSLTGGGTIHWKDHMSYAYKGASLLVLSGDNDFSGTLIVNQDASNNGGSLQHVSLAHENAAKNMTINLWGDENARPGLAVSTKSARVAGVGGTVSTFVYAGPVKSDWSADNPASTALNTLTIDTKGKTHTYNGTILGDATNGLNIVKTGEGEQAFSNAGNVVHDATALQGHLNFTAAPTIHGDVSIAQGAQLTIGSGAYTLNSGHTLNVLAGTPGEQAVLNNQLVLNGGTLGFSVYDTSTPVLNSKGISLGGDAGIVNLEFSKLENIETGVSYVLSAGDWSACDDFNVTLARFYQASITAGSSGLSVSFDLSKNVVRWEGAGTEWNAGSEIFFSEADNISAAELAGATSVNTGIFLNAGDYTISSSDGGSLSFGNIEKYGAGRLIINSAVHAGTLQVMDDSSISGNGTLTAESIGLYADLTTGMAVDVTTISNGGAYTWTLDGSEREFSQKLSRGQLATLGEVRIVGKAALDISTASTTTSAETVQVSNVSGDGTLVLNLGTNFGNKLAVADKFCGTTRVLSGNLDLSGSSFGNTLQLGDDVNACMNSGTWIVDKNLVLEGSSEVHANSGSNTTFKGSVTGKGTYDSRGSGTVTFEGDVDLNAFEQAVGVTVNFNGTTKLGTLELSNGTVNIGTDATASVDALNVSGAGRVNISDGATLDITTAKTTGHYTVANIAGTGTLGVKLGTGYNQQLSITSGFEGTTYVQSGRFVLNGSTFGNTLRIGDAVNACMNSGTWTVDKALVLEGASEVHANSGSNTTFKGSITGEGTYDSRGSGVVTFEGDVDLNAFEQTADKVTTTVNFNGITTLGNLEQSKGTVNIGANATVTISEVLSVTGGTFNIKENASVNIADGATVSANAVSMSTGASVNIEANATATISKVLSVTGGAFNIKENARLNITDGATASVNALNMSAGASVNIGDGASLNFTTTKTSGDYTVTNVTGTGTLGVKVGTDYSQKLAIDSAFEGTTHVQAGCITLNGSTFGNVLRMSNDANMQINGVASYVLDQDLVLDSETEVHQNSYKGKGSNLTINGTVSGAGTYDRRGGGVLTINGLVNLGGILHSISGSTTKLMNDATVGNVKLTNGVVEVHKTASITTLNAGYNGTLRVKSDGLLKLGNPESGPQIQVSKADAELKAISGNAVDYAAGSTDFEISNAYVQALSSDAVTLANRLTNATVENIGSGKLTVDNAANTLTGVHATMGDIAVLNAAQLDLQELEIAAGKTITAANVVVSELARLEAGATLAGNLELANAAVIELGGKVTLDGMLSLQTGLTLSGAVLDVVQGLAVGESHILFTGVDGLKVQSLQQAVTLYNMRSLAEQTNDAVSYSALMDGGQVAAADYFSNLSGNSGLVLSYNGTAGTVTITNTQAVPEPTTATLSLLALAGLCARRRRR